MHDLPAKEQDTLKRAAADSAAALVESGMVVGLGSGSTAAFAVSALAHRVRAGLRMVGIPTSEQTAREARTQGIPLTTWAEHARIDITIDGADEIELVSLSLIKGHGGALLREKIVATASTRLVIVADETKLVERLGRKTTIPVEVIPFGWEVTARRLEDAGAKTALRRADGDQPFLSDGGHLILDCMFPTEASSEALAEALDRTVGVVEHGLFLGMTSEAHVAHSAGVRVLRAAGTRRGDRD
ncbi:MAG TPA: ribose-5-phosphate isomerase RpiA [Bryobacteraceae bacterium]|jgi:ribose 5-phosphate isomerase A